MPRPPRCRRVCAEPEFDIFTPNGIPNHGKILLTVDEYEAVRLIDLEGLTHADTAKQMDISRPTVTETYNSARQKIADCIVNGKKMFVTGGKYQLCGGSACSSCTKSSDKTIAKAKEKNIMRIAVTFENGQIFQHFGHTAEFKFYDIDDGKITNAEVISANGSGHGALAGFLADNGVDILICGGIGGGAQAALADAGIKLFGGVFGSADDAVNAFLNDTLEYNPGVRCSHHDNEHGNGEHSCGSHGCGSHSCH